MSTKNDPDDSPKFVRDYFADLANNGFGQHRITYDPANPEEKAEAERLIGQIHGLLRPTPTPGASTVPPAEPLLSEVRIRFLAETKATKRPATVEKLEGSLDLFEKLVGDRPVSTYSQTDLGDFKGKLLRLPKNPSKDARIRDKSVQQLVGEDLASAGIEMISRRTLNTHLVNVVQAFKWAEAHYKSVPKITTGKLLLAIKKRPDESRKVFSQSDLDVLFGTKFAALPDHKKWLLRLGLYTGARIEEICQLDLTKDVYQDEGVWVLDFNDLDDKNLKTAASKRKVPIHPKLIDLGLLCYFEKVKRAGRKRPFPEWEPYRGKFSKNASKWFGRTYKKVSCGITDPLKTFHSFRHTVLDQLKQRGVYEGHAAAISGQTYHGITYATYGKQYSSKLLREEIAKLEFKLPND